MKLYALIAFFVFGCDEPTIVKNVDVESTNSVHAQDFALNAVGGLIKGGLSNPEALEREINKPGDDNPYTRVDIDNDGKRDIILIDEVVPHEKFEFIAHPGNGVPDQSIAVANFTMDNGTVHYHANYTSYVYGYDNPEYRYYDTFAHDLLWVTWMSSFSRPVYLGVPTPYSFYRSAPRTQFITKQTTIFHTTNIQVTPSAPKSMTFNSSSFSSKVTPPHTFGSGSRTSTPSSHPAFSSRSSSSSSFSSKSSSSSRPSSSFSSRSSSSSFSSRRR